MTFINIHAHSQWSALDGIGSTDQRAEEVARLGQPALGLTDHGTLGGALHHIRSCEKYGVMPIVGVEAYFRPDRLTHEKETNWDYYHLLLLARNLRGWKNLIRLTSESYQEESFYRKPTVDYELLRKYADGLHCTTSCVASFLSRAFQRGDEEGAQDHLNQLKSIFGDHLTVEIHPNEIGIQQPYNLACIGLAQSNSIRLSVGVDSHYPYKEWVQTQDIALMMSTGQTYQSRAFAAEAGEEAFQFDAKELWLLSEEEVLSGFRRHHPDLPEGIVLEAMRNTSLIIEEEFAPFMVSAHRKLPKVEDGIDVLRKWTIEGMNGYVSTRRDAGAPLSESDVMSYLERVNYELGVFEKNNIADYMVIVGDLIRWMKSEDILVGPGRGSSAGSLVCFLSGITQVDPIPYKLLFERFINPDRKDLPDIDIDVDARHRDRAIGYLREKYGAEFVSNIVAYQTIGARSALKKVGAVFGVSFARIEALTKKIPEPYDGTLQDLADTDEDFVKFAIDHPDVWLHAERLMGSTAAQSKHAAGVVVADRPITDYMPTMRSKDGETVTAWTNRNEYAIMSEFGFLKIDILGLDALSKRAYACEMIEANGGPRIDFNQDPGRICWDPDGADPEVLKDLRESIVAGVFQISKSGGMRQTLRDMHCDHFNDIVATIALFRPGPIKNIPSYIRRKHGKEKIDIPDERMRDSLEDTYGLYVFQEQAMMLSKALAGFTPGEAEVLRKAIGKKDAKLMETLKGKFLSGCHGRGVEQELAQRTWDRLEDSARYSFNKSHAVVYGVGSYQDAWLKHYHPEMYAAILTFGVSGSKKEDRDEQTLRILREALFMGVKILPPDINLSGDDYGCHDGVVRFGFEAIAGVGPVAADSIVEFRGDEPYRSMEDFRKRVPPKKANKAVMDKLELCGAFDSIGGRTMMDGPTKAAHEKMLLGFDLGADRNELVEFCRQRSKSLIELTEAPPESRAVVAGEVSKVKEIITKKGDAMAFIEISLGPEDFSVTMFPQMWMTHRQFCSVGEIVIVSGELEHRERGPTVKCQHLMRAAELRQKLRDKGELA